MSGLRHSVSLRWNEVAEDSYLENAYSLIIGISEYKDPRIPGLKYTHADAEGIFKLLTDPKKLGLSKDKIKILLDRDATQFNIKNAISSWLFKNADEDSVVFIFYAGHGGVEEDRLGLEKDHLAKYLLPYDTVLEDFYSSALSNRDFNELLLTIRSKKLVIFMDSCYSGGVSERKARDVKIAEDPYQKLAEGKGRIVIAASQPDQRSYEDSKIGHGVFTYNLLEALSGKADLDNDGYVTVLDAYKYVQDTVPRDAMKMAGGKQEPILRGDITKDFVISIDRERFAKIEKEKVLEEKLGRLQNFYDDGKLSGKQYEYLREILKIEPGELKDKNKKIVKRINDLLSGNISIPTFLEDLEGLEPELFVIPEKKRLEQERLRRQREEEDRIQREKEREKAAKEAQLKAQEMANRLEQERLQRLREEEERAQREREEKERIEGEKEQPGVKREEKGPSYNKLLVATSVLVILLLGYWMMAPGATNAPENLKPTPSLTPKITPIVSSIPIATVVPMPIATPIPAQNSLLTPSLKRLNVVTEVFNNDVGAAATAGLERTGYGQAFENGYYYVVDWQEDKYVAVNGKIDKLAKLILDQQKIPRDDGTYYIERKTLGVKETWDIGGGWTLTANAIDAKATPRLAWLVLSKDGVEKDSMIISEKRIYTYVEKSLAGESDVPLFVSYVDRIFAGVTSDVVQFEYTWVISPDVTTIRAGD